MNSKTRFMLVSIVALAAHVTHGTIFSANMSADEQLKAPDQKYEKVGTILKQFLVKHEALNKLNMSALVSPLPYTRVVDGKILVDISTFGDANNVLNDLIALGLTDGAQYQKQISGFMPIERANEFLAHPGLRFITASQFKTRVGSTTTQGDIAMKTNVARTEFGVDGTGITVCTLSNSFNTQNGYAADIATGDLPPDVTIFKDEAMPDTDEGRGMVQIVHDIAPGAKLCFRSAAFGEADYAAAIHYLASRGIPILDDDIFYFSEPMFQDGIVAQAATYAVTVFGTHFFSAAGNVGDQSYESPFRNSSLPPPAPVSGSGLTGFAHDFDSGAGVDIQQRFTLDPDENLTLTFQWTQPFVNACEGICPGPNTDFDLGLFDASSNTYVALATDNNLVSGMPLEIISYVNETNAVQNLELVIVKKIGPDPALIKYIGVSDIGPTEFATNSSTLFGHANADKVIAVASAAFFNLPPESGTPFVNNGSALGGTPIYFDTKNQPLPMPVIRANPNITAPDGGNNTFFGFDSAQDADSFPNFFGTSAATPHAAALAALILDHASGTISPEAMQTILETTALDIPGPGLGFDYKSGLGLVQAAGPLGAVCADLDHDNLCISLDECVDVPSKTRAGRCGCDVPEGDCKPRLASGTASLFLPSNSILGGATSSTTLAPWQHDTRPSATEAEALHKNAPAPSAEIAPRPVELAAHTKEEAEQPSSCSSANSPVDSLLLVILLLGWLMVRRK